MTKKGNILWADDEIDLLKPHILYLEDKGYSVTSVYSGEDAIQQVEQSQFDLVLLDEMMTGLDGLTTLNHIKEISPNIPVIMITKNEEESLMEEAIASQITNYLTKPVNPSQILLACKNVLETKKIQSDFATQGFLKDFQELSQQISDASDLNDWYSLFESLTKWELRFDELGDHGLGELLNEQKENANRRFSQFIESEYTHLISDSSDVITSPDILSAYIKPLLEDMKDVVFIVIDCLRADQWKAMEKILYENFNTQTEYHLSILPTATPFSRNAIFSGEYPQNFPILFPQEWEEMKNDEKSMNRYEEHFLKSYLLRHNFSDISSSYTKIITPSDGQKFASRIGEFKNINLISIVVNFVDMLGHSRSESNVLKELIPNESAYRNAVCSWVEQSWFYDVLQQLSQWDKTVIITSDHGSHRVRKPIQVKGDRETSTGIRYKYGKNLHVSSKVALKIEDLDAYKLPKIDGADEYIIAKGENYFLYPNNYHQFARRYENSFQHGGITLDEMIVPIGILKGKK